MTELPSPQAAMSYAVGIAAHEGASTLDLDRARTWVLIAAELRAGHVPRPVAETVAPVADQGATQVIDMQTMCQSCGFDVQLVSGDLVHAHSKRRSCPVPDGSGQRTYAQ